MNDSFDKVYFFFEDDSWHGYESESVWAQALRDNQYQIENTPFFAKEISYKDIVAVRNVDGKNIFESVSVRSGHSTYRIFFETNKSEVLFEIYWKPLSKLGCTYERSGKSLLIFAVDVPPSADIYEVYSLLEKGESADIWEFDEGHCGHVPK